MCSFLYYSQYPHHKDLHSFPTRRSSDLKNKGLYSHHCFRRYFHCSRCKRKTGCGCITCSDMDGLHLRRSRDSQENSRKQRSEEHTSELQSHSDLVCRLLLEKKNTHIREE